MNKNPKSVKNIVIKHQSGSKANQHETFSFDEHDELSFGRDESTDVHFDPDVDSMVSRSHLKIKKGEKPYEFFAIDQGSLNGSFVNDEKVKDRVKLSPGDKIKLGLKGPEFLFDLDPRPAGSAPTRLMSVPSAKSTVEMDQSDEKKETIGKQTFERAISSERKRSARTLVAASVGLVIVLAALGFTFKDELFASKTEIIERNTETVTIDDSFNAEQIARENNNSIVFLEVGYKLIHAPTGDDVYHEYAVIEDPETGENRTVALYIQNEQGQIEPVLGLAQNVEVGAPIAVAGSSGSGFVVDDGGFILTNRHVVAQWHTTYTFPQEAYNGKLLRYVDNEWQIAEDVPQPPSNWVPANSQMLGRRPLSGKVLEGQNIYLDVTFPDNDLRTPANVVRISNTHDVAMIKIDLPGGLESVTMRDAASDISVGQPLLIMGYPGAAPQVFIGRESVDGFNRQTQMYTIPSPTVSIASVGRIISSSTQELDENIAGYFSMFGDYYQLSGDQPGPGNSGGPIFNKDGHVVGIYTAGNSQGMSFAVPIQYGMDLMNPNRRTVR